MIFFKGIISVKIIHLVMREILKQFLVEPDSNHGGKNKLIQNVIYKKLKKS